MNTPIQLPLTGMRVLDLTRLFPGALCTLILADLGAQVIKVEAPGGDYMRTLIPAAYAALNRNKHSVEIDLKTEEGVTALLKLVTDADVLIESFRPGVLARLGLSAERLRAVNPRLVICALTGFGQDGPRAQEAAHDVNYVGYTGLLNGLVTPPSVQMADVGGAYLAACAILAALLRRERNGQGAFLDSALIDAPLNAAIMLHAMSARRDTPPVLPDEMLSGGLACYGLYRTADGHRMALGALEGKFFRAFCELAGRPDLFPAQYDPARQVWLRSELEGVFASKTRAEWVALLESTAADTCCTPVLDMFEAANDPGVQARGMWVEGNDGTAHTRSPVQPSDVEPPQITPARELGADNDLLE